MKNKRTKQIWIIVASIIIIVIGIYCVTQSINDKSKINKNVNMPNNNAVEIIVKENNNGMQESIGNVQDSATNPNFKAATVQEISGGTNPVNQNQGIDAMLKDKEIRTNK